MTLKVERRSIALSGNQAEEMLKRCLVGNFEQEPSGQDCANVLGSIAIHTAVNNLFRHRKGVVHPAVTHEARQEDLKVMAFNLLVANALIAIEKIEPEALQDPVPAFFRVIAFFEAGSCADRELWDLSLGGIIQSLRGEMTQFVAESVAAIAPENYPEIEAIILQAQEMIGESPGASRYGNQTIH